MKKMLLISMAVIVIGLGVWYIFASGKDTKPVVTDSQKTVKRSDAVNETNQAISTAPDLVLGNPSAPIVITEYADFKCPTCNKFVRSSYIELKREYLDTGKAKIVFRNLPFIAEDSRTAAEGAYCANDQGKFNVYHDALYEHIWNEYYSKGQITEGEAAAVFAVEPLTALVKTLGINDQQFRECVQRGTFKDAINSDLGLSEQDEAIGTPTFIIGGQKIVGAQPFGIFDKLIKAQNQ